MGRECRYSFSDLFQLAHDREWNESERQRFLSLDHDSRNLEIKRLAKKAGNVRTEDRPGSDGLTYTAFWVE